MALPSSGAISLSQVNVELGVSATATRSLNDSTTRTLFGVASGQISMSQGYGKANRVARSLTIGGDTYNYSLAPGSVSGYSSGITDVTLTINGGVVVGSTSTGAYAMTISGFAAGDTVTIINNGYIVGMGGTGGSFGAYGGNPGGGAGPALNAASAVRIYNYGTIGGGGGGGGSGGQWAGIAGAGGGGGGGAGRYAGGAGAGNPESWPYPGYAGQNGGAGSLTAGGYGGAGAGGAGSGGYGGNLGANGNTGGAGSGGGGGGGGAGGACTAGNVRITWLATGTRYGALN